MVWSELSRIALLGTDRGALSPEAKARLAAHGLDPARDTPRLVLEGAALWHSLRRAASVLPVMERPVPPPQTFGEGKAVSARSARHLDRILGGDYRSVLPEFVRHLTQQQRHLPAEQLPGLFDACLQDAALWKMLAPAVGPRGRWLLSLNPDWVALREEPDPAGWRTAPRDRRLALIRSLRRRDPAQATGLLQQTWGEESTADRVAFLELLSVGLSDADEPFLEACLDDRRKEVRSRAAGLLSLLAASALVDRHWERLMEWVVLTAEGRLDLVLPKELDEGARRDGIELRPPAYFGSGQRAGWVGQMVARVPPQRWEKRWGLTPAQLLHLVRTSDWTTLLLPALYEATTRFGDPVWAEALLDFWVQTGVESYWQNEPAKHLLENLNGAVANHFALRYLEHHPDLLPEDHPLTYLLSRSGYEWEDRLAVLVIRGLKQYMTDTASFSLPPTHYLRILQAAAAGINPGLFDTLSTGWNFQSGQWRYWEKPVERFLATLAFRKEMIEELAKE